VDLRVIDAASLLTAQDVIKPDDYMETLRDLNDQVDQDALVFPSEIVKDLERRARGEYLSTWVKALASGRSLPTVPYKYNQAVTGACPDLVDPDAPNDSPTAVAALAYMLRNQGRRVQVVTDDLLPKPFRIPLADACDQLLLQRQTFAEYLVDLGLEDRLC